MPAVAGGDSLLARETYTRPARTILILLALPALAAPGCRRGGVRAPEPPWVFAVLADNRGGNPYHRRLMQSARADRAELFLNLGDMVHPDEGCHWPDFLADLQAACGDEVPTVLERYFVTVGGWEEQYVNRAQRARDPPIAEDRWTYAGDFWWPGYEPDNAAGQQFVDAHFAYRRRAAAPAGPILDYDAWGDYHVRYRNLHVLSVYLTDEWPRAEQMGPHDDPGARARAHQEQAAWLEKRLALARREDPGAAVVVMGHDEDWPARTDDSFPGRLARLLARYRVDLALCGDGHVYKFYPDPATLKLMVPACLKPDRSGYLRVTLDGATMKVEACDEAGRVFETFTKRVGGPILSRQGP